MTNERPGEIESDTAPDAQPETEPAANPEATDDAAEAPWRPSPVSVVRYRDIQGVAEAAAKRFQDVAKRAVQKNDRFIVVLAGGSTPRALYKRLAEPPFRGGVPWSRTYFVFGDERCVPPDHESSNYRMAHETLFEPLEIPDHRVLRMKGEQNPTDAARRYGVRLNDLFLGLPRRHFDLVLLGLGTDGHTASLYPGTAALEETEKWVTANHVPQLDQWRLTLTFKALNSARRVLFLAAGKRKARIVAEAFGGVEHPEPYPCERVAPLNARRELLVDQDAASQLPKDDSGNEPDQS